MTEETGRYRTPGELIQAAREEAHLDLGDLSSRTRIPEHVLGSLELDDYAALSGPLYVRSFLKTLATELKLDTDQLLDRYDRLAAPDEPPAEAGETTWETETSVERVAGPPWLKIARGAAMVLAVALAVWGGVSLITGDDEGSVDQPAVATTPAETGGEDAAQAAGETADEAGDGTATSGENTGDAATDDNTVDNTPDNTATDPIPAAASIVAERDAPEPTVLPSSIPAGTERMVFAGGARYPLVLRLVCSDRVGAAVAVDADASLHGVDWGAARAGVPEDGIESGQPYRVGGRYVIYWGAQDHFVVRLEESDGVELTLNGQIKPVRQRNLGREWVLDATRLRN